MTEMSYLTIGIELVPVTGKVTPMSDPLQAAVAISATLSTAGSVIITVAVTVEGMPSVTVTV